MIVANFEPANLSDTVHCSILSYKYMIFKHGIRARKEKAYSQFRIAYSIFYYWAFQNRFISMYPQAGKKSIACMFK